MTDDRLSAAEITAAIESLDDFARETVLRFLAGYAPAGFRQAVELVRPLADAAVTPTTLPPAVLPESVLRHLPLPTAPPPLTTNRSDVLPPHCWRGLAPTTTDSSTGEDD